MFLPYCNIRKHTPRTTYKKIPKARGTSPVSKFGYTSAGFPSLLAATDLYTDRTLPLVQPTGDSGLLNNFAIPEALLWIAAERHIADDLQTAAGRERAFKHCYVDIREAWRQSEGRLFSSVAKALIKTSPFWEDLEAALVDADLDDQSNDHVNKHEAVDEAWISFKASAKTEALAVAGEYLLNQGRQLGKTIRTNALCDAAQPVHDALVFAPRTTEAVGTMAEDPKDGLAQAHKDFLHSIIVSVRCPTPALPHSSFTAKCIVPLRVLAAASAVQMHQVRRAGEGMNHDQLRKDMRGFGRLWEYRRRVLGNNEADVDNSIITHMASLSKKMDTFNPTLVEVGDSDSDDVFEKAPTRPTRTPAAPPMLTSKNVPPAATPNITPPQPLQNMMLPPDPPTEAHVVGANTTIAFMLTDNDEDDDDFMNEQPAA